MDNRFTVEGKEFSKISGEFLSKDQEEIFLKKNWQSHRKKTGYSSLIGGVIILTFALVDLQGGEPQILLTTIIRSICCLVLIGSTLVLRKKKEYSPSCALVIFLDQIIIVFAMVFVGYIRNLTLIHNLFHISILSLIYYWFLFNRFNLTLAICLISPVILLFSNPAPLGTADILRLILYSVLVNGLGISLIRSSNISRRRDFIIHKKEMELNRELRHTLDRLTRAKEEIKTLKGIIPICSHCKKIRDDEGSWKQIEEYICQHSEAEFSHGLCRDCARELYPGINLSET